jgi:eukaryotic-like serine/threonine-protein kinase
MPFAPQTQLGPYKIISLIGAGGMGEVYRAHDPRLQRDVALKVLPESFTTDPERLRRFEQEARAVAALNHPNIVSVYDVGTADGVHFIVSELLEGETLRKRITPTGMPSRKAVEYAIQLAGGLAAAHERGIVHRDLKPENIFITRNGRLKILDFGLAKLRRPQEQTETVDEPATQTNIGQVLGTAGYMSPEQVKGETTDHRSDIFSFGCILYEMLSGQRAFRRGTSAETMTAILNEEPAELSLQSGPIAPALERIVRHCMEKQPGQRFQSAHDIAFDLETISSTASATAAPASAGARRSRLRQAAVAAVAVLVLAAGLAAVWLRPTAPTAHPKLHRITFRRGTMWNARFTPVGSLIYGAAWEGRPIEVYAAQSGSTEARPLGMPMTDILAVSPSGELAVSTGRHAAEGFESVGMLARSPQGGGAPRDIVDGAEYADWAPDGENLCVVRRVGGKERLEYPLGKVLYETAGWASHPRISPDGKLVAFIDHTYARDDAGHIVTVDQAGNKHTLTIDFVSAQGLAWWPDGKEIWFTATTSGSSRELHAVTVDGKERLVYLGTGTLTLQDIYKDGRVLFARDDMRAGMIGLAPGETKERDLSWHDWTIPRDISNDGKLVSFDETGEAGGETGVIYVRGTDGSPAVRLGEGRAPTLSPDGKWVLALSRISSHGIQELPTGASESRTISLGDILAHQIYFFPDTRHILLLGNVAGGHGLRLWLSDVDGTKPHPISPEGVLVRYRSCISPDGKQVAARDPEGGISIYPVSGGDPIRVPNVQPREDAVHWTPDGKGLLVGTSEIPTNVYVIDLATGQRKPFKSFTLADPTGLFDLAPPSFSADLKNYVYSYNRITSDLYIVDGLK